MNRSLIAAIAEAIKEADVAVYNDVQPFDVYENYAEAALKAHDEFEPTPRPRTFFPDGVQWA